MVTVLVFFMLSYIIHLILRAKLIYEKTTMRPWQDPSRCHASEHPHSHISPIGLGF